MEARSNENEIGTIEQDPIASTSKVKASAVRSAEKKRVSSCSFADTVAQLSIEAYKQTFPALIRQQYDQTVLAVVLLQVPVPISVTESDKGDELTRSQLIVVSLGVGTKVVSAEKITNERQQSMEEGCGDRIVRDMHAEVLARRGFLLFLTNTLNSPENRLKLFTLTESGYVLRPEITVHLYSSSQPCGNACDKRFAKGRQPKLYPDLTANEWPIEQHDVLSLSHVVEGQIAVTIKTNLHTTAPPVEDNDGSTLVGVQRLHKPQEGFIERGNVLSCSDKIAVWMSLGIQGSLLLSTSFSATQRLTQPIYLSTITVGRKYSALHAQRAFCCRMNGFAYPPPPSSSKKRKKQQQVTHNESTVESLFSTHHPTILCTAIKFDESSLLCEPCEDQPSGARFMNQQCLVAWRDSSSLLNETASSYEYEVLDGRSGLAASRSQQTEAAAAESDEFVVSRISSFSLHQHMQQLQSQGSDIRGSYFDAKNAAVDYQAAKSLLRSQQPFDVWTGNKGIEKKQQTKR